jgi:hypothetical protein
MKLSNALACLAFVARTVSLAVGGKQMVIERDSDGLQDIVSNLLLLLTLELLLDLSVSLTTTFRSHTMSIH